MPEGFNYDKNKNSKSKTSELGCIDLVQSGIEDESDDEVCLDSTSKTINNTLDNAPTIKRRRTMEKKHSNEHFATTILESDERFHDDKNTNDNSKSSYLSIIDPVQADANGESDEES